MLDSACHQHGYSRASEQGTISSFGEGLTREQHSRGWHYVSRVDREGRRRGGAPGGGPCTEKQ